MNAYVGRLRNVHWLARLLRMRIFSNTFGTIKQNKEQLVKQSPGNKQSTTEKTKCKTKERGHRLNDLGFSSANSSYQ